MISVDGRAVPARGSVLECCHAAGVEVPALCHDPHVSPGGHCRSCLVEVDGRVVASCTTPARDGATVRTDTRALVAYREDLAELVLASATPRGRVADWAARTGADGRRYRRAPHRPTPPSEHPFLRFDLDACISCRRCEAVCAEVQGQFVYAFAGRGQGTHLTWGPGAFGSTACVSCGACAATCPSGAITDRDRATAPAATRTIRTTCTYCGVGCQLDVHVDEGGDAPRVAWIDGAEAEVNHGHLCVKGRYAHGFARHGDRLTTPLVRRDGQLVPATWEEALAVIVDGLARARRGDDPGVAGLSSSRCTNEENYLFQKWLRAGLGTNDVDCCARVCHGPSAAGMRAAFGTGAATNALDDLERADLLLVVGSNTTEAHPVTGARIKQAVLRGASLLVIDPRRTELAAMADLHLQLRPGTNVPLLNSLAHVIVVEGLVDFAFLAERVEGWEAFEAEIRAHSPERWEETTGVPAWLVREAARRYATAARPMMAHGLGVTEHHQGSEAVMLLCNLALLVGAVGRPGTGVNPLRGQNNVQGAADMGNQPDLLTGYQPVADPEVRARVGAIWGRPVPERPGRTLPEMYEAARRGEIRAMIILGEDVVHTDPDATSVRRALESLDLLVVQELFLSETAKLAHVVLPGASALEKDGTFTNGERRIQRVRRVLPPVAGRADWEVLCLLMAATGLPQALGSPAEILAEVARVAPSFAGVSYDRLDGEGLQWPVPSADHPGTPMLHATRFPRGKGRLSVVPFVPSPSFGHDLALITGRRLAHYNCGTMTRRGPTAEIVGEDRLDLHPTDADAHGIAEGDRVRVTSDWGSAVARAHRTDTMLPGSLFLSFHYPDTGTNVVTGDVRDRHTGCPEYKLTAVTIERIVGG